jgi:hypothetical protein
MNVQAPTTATLHHRPTQSALAVLVALIVAGATIGMIAIVNNGDDSATSPSPAVSKASPDRVLDGSPLLRGTANKVDPNRVLDGSPLVRGTSAPAVTAGGGDASGGYRFSIAPKSLRTHAPSVQGTLRPPAGLPYGFRGLRP